MKFPKCFQWREDESKCITEEYRNSAPTALVTTTGGVANHERSHGSYVKNFVDKNPDIPREYFGKWMDILYKVEKTQEEKSNVQIQEHTQKAVKEIDLAGSEEVELNEVTTDGGERGSDEGKGNESAAKMPEQNQPKPPTKPKPSDFNVPETDEEYDRMVEGMMTCGMRFNEAEANIKTRKTAYNRAVREYDRDNKPPVTRKAPGKARKSSC